MCDLFEITAFVTSITTLITLADKNVPRIKIINLGALREIIPQCKPEVFRRLTLTRSAWTDATESVWSLAMREQASLGNGETFFGCPQT